MNGVLYTHVIPAFLTIIVLCGYIELDKWFTKRQLKKWRGKDE